MASIIGVETLQHTNGTTAATIDSSGRVSTPARPSFKAYADDGWIGISGNTDTVFAFDHTEHNVGSHYSTGTRNLHALWMVCTSLQHKHTLIKRQMLKHELL